MKTSSAKAKGRRAAQETKDLLLKYGKHLQDADLVVTSSGDTGEDIKMSPLARYFYKFAIECKNTEKINIWQALEQAHSHSEAFPGVLFFKRNKTELHVAMKAEDFLKLITGWQP